MPADTASGEALRIETRGVGVGHRVDLGQCSIDATAYRTAATLQRCNLGPRRRGVACSQRMVSQAEGHMDILGIDIDSIVDLGTQVGISGAIGSAVLVGDDIFEYIIGVAILIYELHPGA